MMTFVITAAMQEAIDRLTTSYSYDRPERWRGAYEQLAPLREYARNVRGQFYYMATRLDALLFITAVVLSIASDLELLIVGFIIANLPSIAAEAIMNRAYPVLEAVEAVEKAYSGLTGEEREDEF